MTRHTTRALLFAALLSVAYPVAADEFGQIAQAADSLAAAGKMLVMSNDRLHALLSDADAANDPFLISVCAPDDFAKAHIKGSINIPRGAFFKPANLAKLPSKDKLIVTYCYTGTGAIGPATVLNLMGYQAMQLEWGTMGWSKNDAALGPATRFPESQQNYPVETKAREAMATHTRPSVSTGKSDLVAILVARGDAVEAADKTVSIIAEQVQALLTDGDGANDPFVLDIRDPADYAKGHVAGAVNIPAALVYREANLAKLPPDRRIVVVDYNGQTAVGVSYVLSIMGYNARGLQYGMMGWSEDDRLLGKHRRFPADQKDYPINTAAHRAG